MESNPSFLTILIDFESMLKEISIQTVKKEDGLLVDFRYVISNLCIFLNSFALMHRENKLCVLLHDSSGVQFLFPDADNTSDDDEAFDLKSSATKLSEIFLNGMTSNLKRFKDKKDGEVKSYMSAALSTTLSVINRVQFPTLQCQILNIQFGPDAPQNYNSVMNSIFR